MKTFKMNVDYLVQQAFTKNKESKSVILFG